MADKQCSRRQFVGTSIALAGAGILGSRSTEARESGPESHLPEHWHGESDVVVVGFGAAGAAAAYEAALAGAKVTLLDTSATGGGDTAISGGYIFMGGGTGLQQNTGYQETAEQMFQVVRAMGGDGADPNLIKIWCERSVDLYNWLTSAVGVQYDPTSLSFSGMEQHAEFKPLAPNGNPVPHCHLALGGAPFRGGAFLFAKLSALVLGKGITFKGQTKVTRLIQHPVTKHVIGVAAKAVDATGKILPDAPEQFFKAARGVVIATGAFSANREMMARHNPQLLSFYHWAQSNADGSGIQLAQEGGADVRFMKTWWNMAFAAVSPTTARSVIVTPKGLRFVAEDGNFYWLGYHLVAQHPIAYSIFDQSVMGGGVAAEGTLSAGSIDELVDAINARDGIDMSPEVLRATIDAYNLLANDQGSDPVFRKSPEFVVPLLTPPYYAVKLTAAETMGTTGGGLRVNTESQVLDPDGSPIGGLYAAGTCCNLTISERYTGSGTAIAGALIFGRIAGQRAAANRHHEHHGR